MLTTIIEDMDGNIIGESTYIKENYSFKELTLKNKRMRISFNDSFLDELDFFLGVLTPDTKRNDFLICFLNKALLDYLDVNLDDVKGAYLFDSFDYLNELNLKDLIFDSYENNHDLKFKVLHYLEDILIKSVTYKFFRFKDMIYFRICNSDDLDVLNKSIKESIENSKLSVGIIQANQWVYGNRTFCKTNNVELSNIHELEIFNKNILYRESASVEELKYILDAILNREQFFFQDNLELIYDGKIRHVTEFIYPTSFNNQPAIEVIFLDRTEEEKLKREFVDLNRKKEIILKLGKLAVCQVTKGKLFWSSEIFSIFEMPPNQLDLSKKINTLEDFFSIFKEFIFKTDSIDLHNDINKQKKEMSNVKLNFRIKTKKGNIKFINCEFIIYGENPLTLTGFVQDISYEESLKNELNYQLAEYENLYGHLQQSKANLEMELKRKSLILEYIYNKLNKNLKIFIFLLSSYLNSNKEISDNYHKIFQKRIEILCRDNFISQNFEYFEQMSFEDFIKIFINDYYSKLFESHIITMDINKNIFFNRDEIDLLYLILSEYFLNMLKIDDKYKGSFEIKGIVLDDFIKISVKSFNYEFLDLDYIDVLKFLKKLENIRLNDIFLENNEETIEIIILFENGTLEEDSYCNENVLLNDTKIEKNELKIERKNLFD